MTENTLLTTDATFHAEIEKELNHRKEFWLHKMETAQTADALQVWYDAMMQDTDVLAHYKIGSDEARDWSQEAESMKQQRSQEVFQGKTLMKNYSWPAMGLAIACVGLAAVATPALAAASLGASAVAAGFALFDTISQARSTIKDRQQGKSKGIQKTNNFNLLGSIGSLGIGGLILGATLTGIFPPVGILVLGAVVCMPFIAKLCVRAAKTNARQQEAAHARKNSQTLFENLQNAETSREQLASQEIEIPARRATMINNNSHRTPAADRTQEKQLEILRSARLAPPTSPSSSHTQTPAQEEEQEETSIFIKNI